jgi:hypothetical protein
MESNIETPITSILSLYDRLHAHRGDFTPSPEISELFSQLMTICLAPIPTAHSSTILSDPRIQKLLPGLHTLCCVSESELEQYWSCRISAAIDRKSLHSELILPYKSPGDLLIDGNDYSKK